jgi:hypothetical protein
MEVDKSSESTQTPSQPEQKLLKDILDRYIKSQVELCEVLVEVFKRMNPEEFDETKKRKTE